MQDAGNATEVLNHDVFLYQIPLAGEEDDALIAMFSRTLEDEILRSIPKVCYNFCTEYSLLILIHFQSLISLCL
jgi:hypothetical protein